MTISASGTGRIGHVVLVEDEPDVRHILKTTLERCAHLRVSTASCGETGLALIKDQHPDAVVLDYALPKVTGSEVLTEIKSSSYLADIPVFVMTGNRHVETCLDLGAEEIFYKPFDVLVLAERLSKACRVNAEPRTQS